MTLNVSKMEPVEIMARAIQKILIDQDLSCRKIISTHDMPGYDGMKSPYIMLAERYTSLRITPIDVTVISRHHAAKYGRTTMVRIDTIVASDPEFVSRLMEAIRLSELEGNEMASYA